MQQDARYRVAEIEALPEGRGQAVAIGETEILLVRDGDTVRAYAAKCPHAGAPLEAGAVCNGHIVCPWHKGAFRLSDGALVEPPALVGLTRYPVSVDAAGGVHVSPTPIEPPTPDPARTSRRAVVIGAGAAASAAVVGLRENGFGGEIILIGREQPPYDRTVLSKFVMSGEQAPPEVPLLIDDVRYRALRVTRIQDEVTRLDPAAKTVTLAGGLELSYDTALVATGGKPKPLEIAGSDLDGVHLLRSRADASAIVNGLSEGMRAVVIGGSFIGLEVAASLRQRGLDVAVVMPETVPFARQFGERIGQMFLDLQTGNGVAVHAGSKVAEIVGNGRVERVMLEDGRGLPADIVVAGLGVTPDTGFIQGIALEDDGGIKVDASMCAADSLYAAGDLASFPLPGRTDRVRIEHWRLAQQHGLVAAAAMAGANSSYAGVPFFWTAQFGKRFEYLGHATEWDEVLIEGDLSAQDFVALLVAGGAVAGALACGRERAMAVLAERMRTPLARDAALAVIRAN